MTYPDNFENKIKFDKIRQLITSNCLSDMGRVLVNDIIFSSDFEWIKQSLEETTEFMHICTEEDSFPVSYYQDARPFLARVRVEGLFLEINELIILKNSLESLNSIVRFFRDKQERFPRLTERAGNIQIFPYVLQRLDSIVSKYGTIKDSASPALGTIRHTIAKKQSGISRRMQSLLQKAQEEGWADKDTNIAIRDGRMVIPVPSAYKRKLNGIVHDESVTGKTSYIEPTEIIETNNEIRELQLEEKREITRILRKFADDLRPYIDSLIPAYDFMAFIDFIRAKSLFSLQINAIAPPFEDRPEMLWYKAKHPLLYLSLKNNGKEIVPLNIEVNEEQRIILISGPNAGGKSVCLQTVGLLQYMFQCGIPVPVEESSKFGIFKKILIDIGDEQSLENDLSTYSSHLTNMKNFLRHGTNDTLILIDEFGTGTEPMLGGAIAEAILNKLNENKVKGIITTHYTNLKHFASSAPGITNGAMLYDAHRMLPLFELEIGKPGSSFAFEIAKKIGLPQDILDDAARKIGEEHVNFDKHLKEIIRDKRYWEEKRKRIHENEKRLEEVLEKYKTELNDTSKLRKEIIKEAKEQAKEIIASANRTVEHTIKEIKESQAEKERTRLAKKQLEAEKENLNQQDEKEEARLQQKIEKIKNREKKRQKQNKTSQTETAPSSTPSSTLSKGDLVQVDGKTVGEILELNTKDATIALGPLQMKVKLDRLTKISNNQAKKFVSPQPQIRTSNYIENISRKREGFKAEIDVRGLRGDEALQKVMELIDDAVMLNVKELRVLHGTGTGALRQIIREYLRTNPVVSSCGDDHVHLGGAGITVIKLDI